MNNREITVVTGESQLKLGSIKRAFARAGLKAHFIIEKADSQANAQPEGLDETMRGANTRAVTFAKKHPYAFAVGIESGAFANGSGHNDKAGIVMYYPDDGGRGDLDRPTPQTLKYKMTQVTAAAPNFPPEAVAIARRRGFKTTTIGSVMQELYGSLSEDPHAHLTSYHTNRSEMLETTLLSMAFDIVTYLDAQTIDLRDEGKPFYTVTGDHLTVHLPIRTTESGLRLAFFDLLSAKALDANADERLAEKLSAKLPKDTEILVVPEGKSVAMARLLAKMNGLKLVVLRKKNRHVNPSVDVQAYGSVTTEGGQRLYLTADNQHALQGKAVICFDDVISSGGTALACEELARRNGATQVTHLLVFTEGDDWKQLIPAERVIALASLPIPVP